MRWRRRYVIAGALVVTLALALPSHLRTRHEPQWRGKGLLQWFLEFRQARITHRVPVQVPAQFRLPSAPGSNSRAPVSAYHEDFDGLFRDPAADALRALGTNALPFLEAELRRRDSRWARGYGQFYSKLPAPFRKHAPTPPIPRDSIRSDAALALAALGPAAASAVPSIIEVFSTEVRLRRMHYLHESLRRLPRSPEAFDQTLENLCRQGELLDAVQTINDFQLMSLRAARVLTNAILSTNFLARPLAMGQFTRFQRHAALALPALVAALERGDSATRRSAATVVESFGAEAASALPALVTALQSQDDELRYLAARALESLGTNALPAVPALTLATNDSSTMVQRVAARTLKKLDGSSAR